MSKETDAAKRTAYANGVRDAINMATLDLRAAFIAAANAATTKTHDELIALGRAFERNMVNDQATAAINEKLGATAQSATLRSYAQFRSRGGPSGYRSGDSGRNRRYSGGLLKSALSSKSFYRADADSLAFINVASLDTHAKQWARLNFGAGPAGEKSPGSRPFPVQISNLIVAELGLSERPSRAFFLPAGYFAGAEGYSRAATGRHAFYLAGTGPTPGARTEDRMLSRGIRAEHFLDAGIAAVARDLGPAYIDHVQTLAREGIVRIRPTTAVTFNKPTRRRPRPSR